MDVPDKFQNFGKGMESSAETKGGNELTFFKRQLWSEL